MNDRGWISRIGIVGTSVTTLCCLGAGWMVSIASALGAGFLLHDETLRPLLIATLLIAVVGHVLNWRRHRNSWVLAMAVTSAVLLYVSIFGGGPGALAWPAFLLLIGASVLEYLIARRSSRDDQSINDSEGIPC
jgi:F0F1-type ATP synthase membrane subunit c/vacuolar-type H+-ATPase subunit K